jgi:hypothetical protein
VEFQNLLPSGCNFDVLVAATYTICVPAPGENHARLVFTVDSHNATAGAVNVLLYINDSSGGRVLLDALAVPANTTYTSTDKFPNGIFIRDSQYLEFLSPFGTPPWYTAWADLPQLEYRGRV